MSRRTTRRQFLATSSAIAAPLFIPAEILGRDPKKPAPSERITMAAIGVGGRGSTNLGIFHGRPDVEVVAVSDVDARHLSRGLGRAGLKAKDGSKDFREVVARKDIDTVMVGTPDHWHALIAIAAVEAGKDVYCEKPLAASVAEGRALVRAVKASKRILQCGTQRRSMAGCRFACELVRNGRIGKLQKVEVGVPGRFAIRGGFTGLEKEQPVPEGFDYETWLGPRPKAPYTAARCHFNFRWVMDYAPGYITDWGAHYLDIAHWGIGADDDGPVSIEATDVKFREKGIYDAPESFKITYTYPNGAQALMFSTTDKSKWGMRFFGEKGTVYVESQNVVTDPSSIKTTKIGEDEIRLYDAKNNHHGNFIDCVRSRKQPSAPVEIAQKSAAACHAGGVACQVGGKLRWDSKTERFVANEAANKLLDRGLREPWELPNA